ncbi:MAG: sigma-70 family RNA polymerase sigma factor [bacterium]
MTKLKTQSAVFSIVEAEYPNQYKRMVKFLFSRGISEDESHDLINDAWLKAMQTFDESKHISEVQWAWWLLQHNMLPDRGRKKKKFKHEYFSADENPDDHPVLEESQPTHEADLLTGFLQKHLPDDLATTLEVLISILQKTNSKHIYRETAQQLGLSIKECRNLMKRLRRACNKLKAKWEKQQ